MKGVHATIKQKLLPTQRTRRKTNKKRLEAKNTGACMDCEYIRIEKQGLSRFNKKHFAGERPAP
ncbi:MAG: hypothetical protein GXY54_06750 [Deltaproteobacteria bacterium]|nr:hypothetical protein [Deltaproteobacteria bacterium]